MNQMHCIAMHDCDFLGSMWSGGQRLVDAMVKVLHLQASPSSGDH